MDTDYKGTFNFTWYHFDINMEILANKIRDSGIHINSIYGIPRGGLVVAVKLSHRLDLPMVPADMVTKRTLIVDDISDTGFTLSVIKDGEHRLCPIATLFYNEGSKVEPDFYAWKQDKDDIQWIQFPWEVKIG